MMASGPQIAELAVTFAAAVAPFRTAFVHAADDFGTTIFWSRASSMVATLWFAVSSESALIVAISAVHFLAMLPFHLRACLERARLRDRLARRFGEALVPKIMKDNGFERLMRLFPASTSGSRS